MFKTWKSQKNNLNFFESQLLSKYFHTNPKVLRHFFSASTFLGFFHGKGGGGLIHSKALNAYIQGKLGLIKSVSKFKKFGLTKKCLKRSNKLRGVEGGSDLSWKILKLKMHLFYELPHL